jgi:hypothetical protein
LTTILPILSENCESRNNPHLVQAFLKKWWVESDFKAPNFPLSLRLKGSGCHYNSIYNHTVITLILFYFKSEFFAHHKLVISLKTRINSQNPAIIFNED